MTHTILVIEDNDDVRDNMAEILELANYSILTARNGMEGLDVARKNLPSLILCDIMMPELDGYGVLRALSNNPQTKTIPFIFISAKSEKQDFRKGMDLGADDYLTKPFNGDDLLSVVEARLKKSAYTKQISANSSELDEFFKRTESIGNIYDYSNKIIQKKLRKKDVLFNEGDAAKYLYYVVSGKIKTFQTNEQGKEYIMQVYKEGDFFGYSSLLDSSNYDYSGIALEDCEIAAILKPDFFQLLLSNAELNAKFLKYISSDLSEANDKLIKLAYNSARKRVAEALLFMARKYHTDPQDNITFPVSRDDLSALSAISPESVSRNLTDFRTENLVDVQGGQIKILNFKKLSEIKN